MVEVKFKLVKRDFVWIGLIVVLLCVGVGYAYGGSDPSVMGHTLGEILVGNALTISGVSPDLLFSESDNDNWRVRANSGDLRFQSCSGDDFSSCSNVVQFDGDGHIVASAPVESGQVATKGYVDDAGYISFTDCYWTSWDVFCGGLGILSLNNVGCGSGEAMTKVELQWINTNSYGSGCSAGVFKKDTNLEHYISHRYKCCKTSIQH